MMTDDSANSPQMVGCHRRRQAPHSRSGGRLQISGIALSLMALVSYSAAFSSNFPRPSFSAAKYAANTPATASTASSRIGTSSLPFLSKSPARLTTLFSSNDPNSDAAEWKAVVSALTLYKAAYGDLKVPQKFVVPAMAPWPGKFRLGHCPLCTHGILSSSEFNFSILCFLLFRGCMGNETRNEGCCDSIHRKVYSK